MRLFFAVETPRDIKDALASLPRSYGHFSLRWTKPENLHVTLLFLGEIADIRLSRIVEAGESVARHTAPFPIIFKTIVLAPPQRPPRMVWLTGETSSQFKKLVWDLSRATGVSADHSPTFHLTLARSREAIPQAPRFAPKTITLPPIEVREFVLMESKLLQEGPTYTPLKIFPFHSLKF